MQGNLKDYVQTLTKLKLILIVVFVCEVAVVYCLKIILKNVPFCFLF